MTARALADPQAKRSVSPAAQFFDIEAGRGCAIHKDAHSRPLDDDTGVKPFIAIGFRNYGPFVLAGTLRSELLPSPKWMGDVLHSVTVAHRVGRAKVEWPEVHRVVRLRIDHAERDAEKAPLNRLAASQHVSLDDSIAKVIAVEPYDTHAFPFADLKRPLPLDVHNGCRAAGDLPPWIFPDGSQVKTFRRLRSRRRCGTR